MRSVRKHGRLPRRDVRERGPCAVAFGPNVGNFPPFGCVIFLSDYNGATATSWTIGVTDNGDGTLTADIVAYY